VARKEKGLQTTLQIRLHPTSEQSRLLMAHCMEYISTVNALVSALDTGILPEKASTKDFVASLPSAVKNQALRDAHSVFKRSLELGTLPVLKKPIAQWNNQNWHLSGSMLTLPMCVDGKTQQVHLSCEGIVYAGIPGILRLKKKRGKWVADLTLTIEKSLPTEEDGVMGVDLGVKVPAVAYVASRGTCFFGNGRYQRYMRRRFYARRKKLQKAKKIQAVKKSQGKESRWMKTINHQLSRQIVNHAKEQGVGTIRVESLAGIRQGTARTSRGASARKNNRMMATWSFYQLTSFIAYKAERLGIKVEQIDPAYTSQECPACRARNKAQDRTYVCTDCGWMGHRDSVGAINISRRASSVGQRQGATGATSARPVDGALDTPQTVTR
jgi:putative transposase